MTASTTAVFAAFSLLCRFSYLADRAEMIGRVGDDPDRHSRLLLVPRGDLGQAFEHALIRRGNAFSECCPLVVIDRFYKPAVFPIDGCCPAVDEFAKPVKVKLGMLGLGRDRRSVKFGRRRIG